MEWNGTTQGHTDKNQFDMAAARSDPQVSLTWAATGTVVAMQNEEKLKRLTVQG